MPYIGSSNTIPGLFKSITLDYGKDQKKPMLQYKEDDKYKDVGYTEAYEHTELFALGLASMGVKRNDKIAIIAENRPEWVYVDNAILGLSSLEAGHMIISALCIAFVALTVSNSTSPGPTPIPINPV